MTLHDLKYPLAYRHLHWLTILPVIVAVFYFHRDVPYHDQWDLLPLIDAYYQGTLSIHHFLAPHNGHILLLPRLVMMALAITTHWNTFAEVLFSLALGTVNFGLVLVLAGQLYGERFTVVHKTAVGLIAFSLAQADNWLWGWQLQVPLCLTGILLGLVALQNLREPALAVAAAAVCGFVASFSFAAGLVFWFAAIPLVWTRKPILLLPWLVTAALCICLYLQLLGNTAPVPSHESDSTGLFYRQAIIDLLSNFLACLGSLAARFHLAAAIAASMLALGYLAIFMRTMPIKHRALLQSLALTGIGSALLIALSRSSMGADQMLASRYTTLCIPFWISVLFVMTTQQRSAFAVRTASVSVLVAILCTSVYSLKDFQRLHNRLERGANALLQPLAPENQKALAIINPRQDPLQAQAEIALLSRYQLSFYRRKNERQ